MIYFREYVVRQVWRYQCTQSDNQKPKQKSKKDWQYNGQKKQRTDNTMVKRNKGQTVIYKTLHRAPKIAGCETHFLH